MASRRTSHRKRFITRHPEPDVNSLSSLDDVGLCDHVTCARPTAAVQNGILGTDPDSHRNSAFIPVRPSIHNDGLSVSNPRATAGQSTAAHQSDRHLLERHHQTPATPDQVRTAIGFRPIRRDSVESESSASVGAHDSELELLTSSVLHQPTRHLQHPVDMSGKHNRLNVSSAGSASSYDNLDNNSYQKHVNESPRIRHRTKQTWIAGQAASSGDAPKLHNDARTRGDKEVDDTSFMSAFGNKALWRRQTGDGHVQFVAPNMVGVFDPSRLRTPNRAPVEPVCSQPLVGSDRRVADVGGTAVDSRQKHTDQITRPLQTDLRTTSKSLFGTTVNNSNDQQIVPDSHRTLRVHGNASGDAIRPPPSNHRRQGDSVSVPVSSLAVNQKLSDTIRSPVSNVTELNTAVGLPSTSFKSHVSVDAKGTSISNHKPSQPIGDINISTQRLCHEIMPQSSSLIADVQKTYEKVNNVTNGKKPVKSPTSSIADSKTVEDRGRYDNVQLPQCDTKDMSDVKVSESSDIAASRTLSPPIQCEQKERNNTYSTPVHIASDRREGIECDDDRREEVECGDVAQQDVDVALAKQTSDESDSKEIIGCELSNEVTPPRSIAPPTTSSQQLEQVANVDVILDSELVEAASSKGSSDNNSSITADKCDEQPKTSPEPINKSPSIQLNWKSVEDIITNDKISSSASDAAAEASHLTRRLSSSSPDDSKRLQAVAPVEAAAGDGSDHDLIMSSAPKTLEVCPGEINSTTTTTTTCDTANNKTSASQQQQRQVVVDNNIVPKNFIDSKTETFLSASATCLTPTCLRRSTPSDKQMTTVSRPGDSNTIQPDVISLSTFPDVKQQPVGDAHHPAAVSIRSSTLTSPLQHQPASNLVMSPSPKTDHTRSRITLLSPCRSLDAEVDRTTSKPTKLTESPKTLCVLAKLSPTAVSKPKNSKQLTTSSDKTTVTSHTDSRPDVTLRSTQDVRLDPVADCLVTEGVSVMAALDDALAVLTSVVSDSRHVDKLASADRSLDAKPSSVTHRHHKQTKKKLTKRSSDVGVVCGGDVTIRRQHEIDAADSWRRRWQNSKTRHEDDSFNRPDSATSEQQRPALFSLPLDSVILHHRRKLQQQADGSETSSSDEQEQQTSYKRLSRRGRLSSSHSVDQMLKAGETDRSRRHSSRSTAQRRPVSSSITAPRGSFTYRC